MPWLEPRRRPGRTCRPRSSSAPKSRSMPSSATFANNGDNGAPWGAPAVVGFHVPSSTVPAFSQRRMVVVNAGSRANKGWCPRLSKQPEMSASSSHSLAPAGASEWLLDADISGCFDNLGHQPLLARLPAFTTTIRRWLKAGTVELGTWKPTTAGAPQGAPLSPLLANVALDGMERLFGAEDERGRHVRPGLRRGSNHGISLIRYADDLVVTAPTREVLETYVGPKLSAFLGERGLRLSEAKTRIAHIDEGFDFLGFSVRRYRGVVLTRPQKEKVVRHLRAIHDYLRQHRQATPSQIIGDLGPVIRGWANYYRHGASKHAFHTADHHVQAKLWRWAKRRHPTKTAAWIRSKYFDSRWNFVDGRTRLAR